MNGMKGWQIFILGILTGLIISASLWLVLQQRNKMEVTFLPYNPATAAPSGTPNPVSAESSSKTITVDGLNLNTATLEELDALPGIGVEKAQAILDFREKNGPFHSIQDLLYVPGIGDSILNQIKTSIYVK